MRTVQVPISRRGWRALLVAAAVILGVALFASCGASGGGSAQGDSAGGGYGAPPATADDGAAAGGTAAGGTAAGGAGGSGEAGTVSEQTLHVWATDGCLEYLVLDSADDTVAVSATNLCRTAVSSFNGSAYAGPGTYYAYFARGASLENWQAVVGQGDDGNTYWEYTDGQLYRQQESDGAAQLLVQYTDGEIKFEDESAYLQADPSGLPFLQRVKEGLDAQFIAQELVGGPLQRNPRLPGSASTEYSQAQDGISAADQQASEYGQSYKDATQSGTSGSQALVEATQASENMHNVWDSADCGDSDNVESGCGGANAFNDDDGVGEGDS